MRVEIDKFKEFTTKLDEIRSVSTHCQLLIKAGEESPEGDGVFRITSESVLKEVLEARKKVLGLNVISSGFGTFLEQFQPYIYWINKSVETIKTYCRALGVKQTQLSLHEPILDGPATDSDMETEQRGRGNEVAKKADGKGPRQSKNPFDSEIDYVSLKALCAELIPSSTKTDGEDVQMKIQDSSLVSTSQQIRPQ